MHCFTRRVTRGMVIAVLALGTGAGSAHAAGTITVSAGGTRTATESDAAYAAPQAGTGFERAAWVADPGTAVWSPLCTADATGTCTGAVAADGRYLVREASAPAGWRSFQALAWGGAAVGASTARPYVGDVTVAGGPAVVHPSIAWNPTAPESGSGPFVVARDNPALPERCALDVLLLLDRSGSISGNAAAYESAARDFVDTLAGTPIRVKISSFAQTARTDQATFLDLSVPADVAAAKATISAVYNAPAGSTNWDGAMRLAATAGVDLVTFITDGNPTAHLSDGSGGNGSTVGLLDLTTGIAAANLVKTQGKAPGAGATIRAVGVGDVTASNLAAMSGPVEGRDYSASGIAGLRAELQALANRLCGARIHVRKLTGDGDPAAPKAGWTIRADSRTAGVTTSPASLVTSGTADDVIGIDRVPAGGAVLDVAEAQQAGYVLVGAACRQGGFAEPAPGGSTSVRLPAVQRGEDYWCTFRNLRARPGIAVEKTGDALAYHGETVSFRFSVRNTGNVPLRDVQVADDRCPGVSPAPVARTNDDGNATLDPLGADGTTPEVWTFSCSYVLGGHTAQEEDPIRNTAAATGTPPTGPPVTATSTHTTDLVHTALTVEKTGPVAAPAGSAVPYAITVVNAGDTVIDGAAVDVTDALCTARPVLTGRGGDVTPASFDSGDRWTWGCSVQTTAGQASVQNVALASSRDVNGRTASASDDAVTTLLSAGAAPASTSRPVDGSGNLGVRRTLPPGSARMRGTTGCVATTARVTVTGRRIRSVTWSLDGRRQHSPAKPGPGGRWTLVVRTKGLRVGTHRVQASVRFVAASRTPARRMVAELTRCRPRAVAAFTG